MINIKNHSGRRSLNLHIRALPALRRISQVCVGLAALVSSAAALIPTAAAQTPNLSPIADYFGAPDSISGLDSFAIADMNNDGRPDFIESISHYISGPCSPQQGQITIRYGPSNFGFTAPAVLTSQDSAYIRKPCVADLNNDGALDIVALYSINSATIPESSGIAILLGGTFNSFTLHAPLVFVNDSKSDFAQTLNVVDINQDGVPDALVGFDHIVPNGTMPKSAASWFDIYSGMADGTFTSPVHVSLTNIESFAAIAADWNGDGRTDVAQISYYSDLIGIVHNTGGVLAESQLLNYVTKPMSVSTGDLNADGFADIVAGGYVMDLAVGLGGAGGLSATPVHYEEVMGEARGLGLADMNNDAKLDAAIVDYSCYASYPTAARLLIGTGDGSFGSGGSAALPGFVFFDGFAFADLNQDGFADVLTNGGSGTAGNASFPKNTTHLSLYMNSLGTPPPPPSAPPHGTPGISTIQPSVIQFGADDLITISGSGFDPACAVSVKPSMIPGAAAVSAASNLFVSSGLLLVKLPAVGIGRVDVIVTNPDGGTVEGFGSIYVAPKLYQKDRFSGSIAWPGDQDALIVDGVAGMKIDVAASVGTRDPIVPVLRVADASMHTILSTSSLESGYQPEFVNINNSKVSIRGFPLPSTGRAYVQIASANGKTGNYSIAYSENFDSKRLRMQISPKSAIPDANGGVIIKFSARAASIVSGNITTKKPTVLAADRVTLEGPGAVQPSFENCVSEAAAGCAIRLRNYVVSATGDYYLTIDPASGPGGSFTGLFTINPPKHKAASYSEGW
ncbi:MAG: VCBS repeat-containing protein [Planctomycetes bacterium]|nr:VCBS repeat-containing protein [Planctomycetota bacterium]